MIISIYRNNEESIENICSRMEKSNSVCTFCITSKLSSTGLDSTMAIVSNDFSINQTNNTVEDDYLKQINLSATGSDLLNDIDLNNNFYSQTFFNIETETINGNNYELIELSNDIDYLTTEQNLEFFQF